ncbi:hypothetical protein HanRHA438_Chr01g0014921 [Helianthus annuus]|nr:hypothetical protein HanRHA438_Chr01g0014921 [Helianthus annuus]
MFFKIITGTAWLLATPDSVQGGSGVVTLMIPTTSSEKSFRAKSKLSSGIT